MFDPWYLVGWAVVALILVSAVCVMVLIVVGTVRQIRSTSPDRPAKLIATRRL